MWLQLPPVEDNTVVSEIGEHWSPNRPDEITQPTMYAGGIPKRTAIGNAIGISNDQVPHEDPVENEINAPNRKIKPGTNPGVRCSATIPAKNSPVPIVETTLPSDHAHTRMNGTFMSSIMPLTNVLNDLIGFHKPFTTPTMPAVMPVQIKATMIATVMFAFLKHPANPLAAKSPVQKITAKSETNSAAIGSTKLISVGS